MQIVIALRHRSDRLNSDEKLKAISALEDAGCEIVVSDTGDAGLLRDALDDEGIDYKRTASEIVVAE